MYIEISDKFNLMDIDPFLYRGKKILITGASGYIGSSIFKVLSDTDCDIVLLTHSQSLKLIAETKARVEIIEGDIAKSDIWNKILPGVDIVFHLAAYEHRHGSKFDPKEDLIINAASVLLMLEVCREKGLSPKIVLASSSNIAGIPQILPVNESAPDNPLTLYAIHKLTAEKYLEYYARNFNIPSCVLRLANIYGPAPNYDISRKVVLNKIIHKAINGGPLILFRNKSKIRDFIFIDDAVGAFLAAGISQNTANGSYYYIGSGQGYTLEKIVMIVGRETEMIMGIASPVEINTETAIEDVEMRDFVADYSSFQNMTGWSPKIGLVAGIDRTIKFFTNEKSN